MAVLDATSSWACFANGLELNTRTSAGWLQTGDVIDLSLADGSRKALIVKRPAEDGAFVVYNEHSILLERESPTKFRLSADWKQLLLAPELNPALPSL